MLHISMFWGVVIALLLAVALLLPFLIVEIRKGESRLKPSAPAGTGDTRPGRAGNPAPGQPEAQADPYSAGARRSN